MSSPRTSDALVPNDLGIDGMLGFFRDHMNDILKPFAENVSEMHKALIGLGDDLCEACGRISMNSESISEHAALMTALRSDLDKTTSLENTTHKLLEATRTEKAALGNLVEMNQEYTRQNVERLDGLINAQQRAIDELRKSLEEQRSKLTMCQDTVTVNQIEVVRTNAGIDRLANSLTVTEHAHDKTAECLRSLKKSVDAHVIDTQAEQSDMLSQMQNSDKIADIRFKELDKKASEALRYAAEIPWIANGQKECTSGIQALGAKFETSVSTIDGIRKKLGETDLLAADTTSKLTDVCEKVSKFTRSAAKDVQDLKRFLETNTASVSRHTHQIKELEVNVYGSGSSATDKHNLIHKMEVDIKHLLKRADRLESVVDTSLTQQRSLSESQTEEYQRIFHQFDADNDGEISISEVGHVIRGLGHDVSDDALKVVIKDIAADNRDGMTFEEFCSMLSKMIGPDGHVDMENYLAAMAEEAVREEKQTKAAELVPILDEEMRKAKDALEQEKHRHDGTFQQLQNLQGDHKLLAEEVRRLQSSLQQKEEYWKGLSEGLREIKKNYSSGDATMLPCAKSLRQALPALGLQRPASSYRRGEQPASEQRWTGAADRVPRRAYTGREAEEAGEFHTPMTPVSPAGDIGRPLSAR